MREIKFRQWKEGRMTMFGFLKDKRGHTSFTCAQSNMLDKYPAMQFTGLTDKNGVEIYEGDIVDTHNRHLGAVEYSSSTFIIEDYDDGDYYHGQDPCYWDWSEFEVIGNIHQNPELLES